MRSRELVIFFAIFLKVTTVTAMADSCSDILSGIYDIRDNSIKSNTIYAFRNWACNSDSASASGNYLQVVSGSGSWSKNRCSNKELSTQEQKDFREIIQNVNEKTVAAWEKCMQRKGLNTGVILSGDPAKFQVVFSYTPVANTLPHATLDSGTNGFLIEGDVSCSADWIKKNHRIIGVSGKTVSCSRKDPAQPITIIINSDPAPNNGGTLSVPGLNPIVAEEPKALDLMAELWDGAPGTLVFNNNSCNSTVMGTLICEYKYTIQYNKITNQWSVTGYNNGSKKVGTWIYENAPKKPGNISAWGKLLTFDNTGHVFANKKDVGTVALR